MARTTDPEPVRVPPSARAWNGFGCWLKTTVLPGGSRASFLSGEVIVEPDPNADPAHKAAIEAVGRTLRALAGDDRPGRLYGPGMRWLWPEVQASHGPDLLFASDTTLDTCRLRPTAAGVVEGVPDWVLEVVGPASGRRDNDLLRQTYYRAGVSEYWIVDPAGDETGFRILKWASDGYTVVGRRGGGWLRSAVFGRRFRLERRRGRGRGLRFELLCEE
jgi:Uma2 family endonuclease